MKAPSLPTGPVRATRRRFLALGLAAPVGLARGADPAPADRDTAVLSAFLSALLRSPDFVWKDRLRDDSVILLHVRAPEKTGMLQGQLTSDAGEHVIDPELVRAIRRRNTRPGTETDGVETSYAGWKVAPPVVVGDITVRPDEDDWDMMRRLHPKAVAWASPWLPGVDREGRRALARCWWGPWPHGAAATAELERDGAGWKVGWMALSLYA